LDLQLGAGSRDHRGRRARIPETRRSATFRTALEAAPARPEVVETGTVREPDGWGTDGCSTLVLGDWVAHDGGRLVSVDVDPGAVETARRPPEPLGPARGGPTPRTSTPSISNFRFAGASQRQTLAEAQLVWTKLSPAGVILLNDAQLDFGGKPGLARAWLLGHGAETLMVGARQVVLSKTTQFAETRTTGLPPRPGPCGASDRPLESARNREAHHAR
jgi:hypothetical protein